ncbi:uncharacterized protein LOC124146677 [Haliotis rufescens]|uniref:uncharacterized protein LOC124146677 n=1 Tax=Haliotis rufescens TaxID=6454 RepID=UPI001EB04056|nr:uncharacterized protein LOC124146677 [Haliotis rufescens]
MSHLNMTYPKKKRKRSVTGNPPELPQNTCVFCRSTEDCEEDYGKVIKKCGFTVHYFCMLFASGLSQSGKTETQGIFGFMPGDIRRELKRGNRLRCTYCKERGATIGCVVTSCRKAFHLTCGRKKGSLHQFYDSFRSYCPDHRPRQTVQISDRLAFVGTANTVCSICMYAVVARSSHETMRAPCCKNSWFHRSCIQRYAMSAGLYFFKCPLCNSKDLFQSEMLHCGIYIPDQDASWEREPNAYQDLYERYSHCDAAKCKCLQGRDYDQDDTKWEIIVCEYCGSKGSHAACRGLELIRKEYACGECAEIEKKRVKKRGKKSPPRVRNRTQAELQHLLEVRVAELVTQKSNQNTPNSKQPTPKSKAGTPSLGSLRSVRRSRRDQRGDVVVMQQEGTDAEVDVEGLGSDEDPSSSETPAMKKRRLSLQRSSRSQTKRIGRHIGTMSSDSRSSSIPSTRGKYSNYVTLSTVTDTEVRKWGTTETESSNSASLLNYMDDSDDVSQTSDSDSEICAVDEVHEDSTKKTVTIKWKGKKIKIYKEVEKDDSEDISKWSLHLEVGDSDDLQPSTSQTPPPDGGKVKEESPPQLVPIDDEITIRCTPPTRPYMLNVKANSVKQQTDKIKGEDVKCEEAPPVLYSVWEEDSQTGGSRITRSMSVDSKNSCSQDYIDSIDIMSRNSNTPRHSRRSLECAFTSHDNRSKSPCLGKRFRENDAESISSAANSVITLSSNVSDTGENESDCLIVEPVYVTENQRNVSDGKVSYSAQIAVGSPFKDGEYPETVPYRRITTGHGSVGVVIDLTDSPSETWLGFADTDNSSRSNRSSYS